jgi:hypothetical protein
MVTAMGMAGAMMTAVTVGTVEVTTVVAEGADNRALVLMAGSACA